MIPRICSKGSLNTADSIFAVQAEREELELAEASKQQFRAAGVGESVPRLPIKDQSVQFDS